MEVLVLAIRNDVTKQRARIDLSSMVANQNAARIRLAGDRAQTAEQIRSQRLGHGGVTRVTEHVGIDILAATIDVQIVNTVAGEFPDGPGGDKWMKLHRDRGPGGSG